MVMRLHVTLYGTLRAGSDDRESKGGVWMELREGASVQDLLARLGIPETAEAVVISEGRILSRDAPLRDQAGVGVFQPLAGG
jgi:sulfur carrier protein ThiS